MQFGGGLVKKLLLGLILFLWPVMALAAPPTPYEAETMLYYPRLSQEQQALFDSIYLAALQGKESVDLPEGTAYDDACLLTELLLLDCPELYALDPQYSVVYLQDRPEEAVRINLRYTMAAGVQQPLVNAAQALVDQAYGDEFQREWILHDLLCARVTYDQEAANSHTAWGALMEGKAVCDGYARAMALVLRMSGIGCGVVQGTTKANGANHAWNLVKVNGSWAWLDPTNNDQPEMITYFFFNLSDQWLERSYTLKQTIPLPACRDEAVSWHEKTWRMVRSAEEMETHIFNNFRNLVQDGARFNLRFENREDYLSLRNGVVAWAERYNMAFDPDVLAALRYWYSDEQQCVVVQLTQ